jgi:transcriptional regulator with XRE-family HTH domain
MPLMLDNQRVKDRREKLSLTMEAAAEAAGMSGRQQWYMIESGRRDDITLSTLDRIANALKCKAKDLLK